MALSILKSCGLKDVSEAVNGAEAAARARERSFDVVFMVRKRDRCNQLRMRCPPSVRDPLLQCWWCSDDETTQCVSWRGTH